MRTGKYWARSSVRASTPAGEEYTRSFLRGSFVSEHDAQRIADEAAEKARRDIEGGQFEDNWYAYCDGTLHELILQEIRSQDGQLLGVITRNSHGVSVLNTNTIVFIDIDLPPKPRVASGLLSRLFGKKPDQSPDPKEQAMDRLRGYCKSSSARGVRVYETYAGLRAMLTTERLDPTGDEVRTLFERLGADQLYTRLCRSQECYRARLSPKPGRLPVGWPPGRFRIDHEPSAQLQRWEGSYKEACASHAVCRLLEDIGAPAQHPDILKIQQLHDEYCGVGVGLPLA